jgi:glycosyltransferase involved in cell wall biosynthesis
LIGWELSSFTGWGNYGLQLVQALRFSGLATPLLTRRPYLDPEIEESLGSYVKDLQEESSEYIDFFELANNETLDTSCDISLESIGNHAPVSKFICHSRVGVAFFERTSFSDDYLSELRKFELIITGSTWNTLLLRNNGCLNVECVFQGVDLAWFNPCPVERFLHRPFVIFSGGKLEPRKGQDIVLKAFREFLKICPDALLIAAWVGWDDYASAIRICPHVDNGPVDGSPESIACWLKEQGIPSRNFIVPSHTPNEQMSNLLKQADVAVFPNRCEGGTNLVAMEALSVGLPVIISENTGHLDLIALDLPYVFKVGADGVGKVTSNLSAMYGGDPANCWGETDPGEIVDLLRFIMKSKRIWRKIGTLYADRMKRFSWSRVMESWQSVMTRNGYFDHNCS